MATLNVGATAPTFALDALDGSRYTLDHRLTLAIFFKTTCPTCQYAWPYYERLHRAYEGAGLQVLGISQHDPEKTRRYATQYGATFPHLIDTRLDVARQYDPEFVPTSFLIDSDRRILEALASWNSARLNQLSSQIATLLQVPPQEIVRPADNAIPFKPG